MSLPDFPEINLPDGTNAVLFNVTPSGATLKSECEQLKANYPSYSPLPSDLDLDLDNNAVSAQIKNLLDLDPENTNSTKFVFVYHTTDSYQKNVTNYKLDNGNFIKDNDAPYEDGDFNDFFDDHFMEQLGEDHLFGVGNTNIYILFSPGLANFIQITPDIVMFNLQPSSSTFTEEYAQMNSYPGYSPLPDDFVITDEIINFINELLVNSDQNHNIIILDHENSYKICEIDFGLIVEDEDNNNNFLDHITNDFTSEEDFSNFMSVMLGKNNINLFILFSIATEEEGAADDILEDTLPEDVPDDTFEELIEELEEKEEVTEDKYRFITYHGKKVRVKILSDPDNVDDKEAFEVPTSLTTIKFNNKNPVILQYKDGNIVVNNYNYFRNGQTLVLNGQEYIIVNGNVLVAVRFIWMFHNSRIMRSAGRPCRKRCMIVLS